MRTLSVPEENKIMDALQNYKLPLITRIFKKVWFYFLKYTFLPVFILLVILFVIYNSFVYFDPKADHIWYVCKTIMFGYIFGVGGFAIISHLCELASTNKLRKKLGLTKDEFIFYVSMYQINGL